MRCSKCNNELKGDDLFCPSCGNPIGNSNLNNMNNNMNNNMPQMNNGMNNMNINNNMPTPMNNNMPTPMNNNMNNNNKDNSNGLKTAALVIGIIVIIAVFIFQIFTMPVSLVGIILGAIATSKQKKINAGLILNIIAFVIAIPILLFYMEVFDINGNKIIGTWNCKNYDGNGEGSSYVITLDIQENNKFTWEKYGDGANNHIKGTYTLEKIDKQNARELGSYYNLSLVSEEFVNNGKLQDQKYTTAYEVGIPLDNDKTAIFMNTSTYNMYACYKQ